MFELYSVPSLTYAVDAVLSLYHNNLPSPPSSPYTASGLAISFNTSSTSVIPILNGKGIMSQAKRYAVELLVHGDITLLTGSYTGYHGDPSKRPNTSSSSSNSSIQLSQRE